MHNWIAYSSHVLKWSRCSVCGLVREEPCHERYWCASEPFNRESMMDSWHTMNWYDIEYDEECDEHFVRKTLAE